MSSRVRAHIRSNIYGILALFLVLTGGTAIANHPGGANTISSGDIINGEVKEADVGQAAVASAELKDGSVVGADVANDALMGADVREDTLSKTILQRRVSAVCPSGQAIRAVTESGGVACQALTGSAPLGPAGGDLTGDYPNPQVAANAIGGTEVANGSLISADIVDSGLAGVDVLDNSLTGADVNESTLDSGSFVTGRSATEIFCSVDSPAGGTSVDCAEVTLNLSRSARLLVMTSGNWYTSSFDPAYSTNDDPSLVAGNCQLIVDGAPKAVQNVGERKTNAAGSEVAWTNTNDANGTISMNAVTDVLPAGTHTAALRCTEADGDIEYQNINTSAVVLGNG